MDHAARYQLLDHATDEAPLWDTRHAIREHRADGTLASLHRDRSPDELRPELERLLRDGHVELWDETDPEHRVLDLAEALDVIRDEQNWFSPMDLGETTRRDAIYALSLTDSGGDEFRQERDRDTPS